MNERALDSTEEKQVPSWPKIAIGLLSLHLLTTLPYPWETEGLARALLRFNPDLVLLIALVLALALRFGCRRALTHLLALGVILVPLYRLGESIMPAIYGKNFEPFEDLRMLPSLLHLLTHQLPPWQQWGSYLVAGLVAVMLYFFVHRMVKWVLATRARPGLAYGILGLCQLVVVAAWLSSASVGPGMVGALLGEAGRIIQTRGWNIEERFQERVEDAQRELARLPKNLAGLAGADVHVLFIESYGRAIFRQPHTQKAYQEATAALIPPLEREGLLVCTAWTHPSIFGGLSSAAHAEFLTGVKVEGWRVLGLIMQSSLQAMPRFFAAAGYRTLHVQPAMTESWPEGKFYGFETDIFHSSFGYAGPKYHWGWMPDQYALARLLEAEIKSSTQPVFSMYVSVTSHAPFSKIPPYYEDWSHAGRSEAHAKGPEKEYPIDWGNFINHPKAEEAYMRAIRYSLRTAVGFASELARLPDRSFIVVVLGDHQPPVSGEMASKLTTKDVPVHVFSNKEELLAPFLARGFSSGWYAGEANESCSSSRFLYRILSDYGR